MEFIEFVKQRKRMCDISSDCSNCPLYELYDQDTVCLTWCANNPLKAQEIVQKWAKENPVKTRKMDFLEKYPNAKIDYLGTPVACVEEIYGIDINCDNISCTECWSVITEEACKQ